MSTYYPITRSNFIEEQLLTPWCYKHSQSQIVLLGAGLDTRVYRFKPFQINQHTIFEIDFPGVIDLKEKLIQNETPLCNIIRLSADLVKPDWSTYLLKNRFSTELPTFWILEGLAYYIPRKIFSDLLSKMAEISQNESCIFIDIIYAISTNFFSKRESWGLTIKEIYIYFATSGWEVTYSVVDENNQERAVKPKSMVFIQGRKKLKIE